jgi:hypothetical protein
MPIEFRESILNIIDGTPASQVIKKKATDLIACDGQSLYKLENTLRGDPELLDAWCAVECALKVDTILWYKIHRHWHAHVVRSVIPLHTFRRGGDRYGNFISSTKKASDKIVVKRSRTTTAPSEGKATSAVQLRNLRGAVSSQEEDNDPAQKNDAPIPVIVQAATRVPWVCTACDTGGLLLKLKNGTPPYSNVAAKRKHRTMVLDQWMHHAARDTAAFFIIDHLLPVLTSNGADVDTTRAATYFVDDVVAANTSFGGHLRLHQIFSPNIDQAVVDDLQARGIVHSARMCACLFLQRSAALIRDLYGGIAVAFLDVWGSLGGNGGLGPLPLIEISTSLRLYEPRMAYVTFATSDRYMRTQGHTSIWAKCLLALFSQCVLYKWTNDCRRM